MSSANKMAADAIVVKKSRWAEVEENTIAAADRKRAKMASRPLFSGSKDRRGHALTPWFSKPPSLTENP